MENFQLVGPVPCHEEKVSVTPNTRFEEREVIHWCELLKIGMSLFTLGRGAARTVTSDVRTCGHDIS